MSDDLDRLFGWTNRRPFGLDDPTLNGLPQEGRAGGGGHIEKSGFIEDGAISARSINVSYNSGGDNLHPDPLFTLWASENSAIGWASESNATKNAVSGSSLYKRGAYRMIFNGNPTPVQSYLGSGLIPIHGYSNSYVTVAIESVMDGYTSGTIRERVEWYDSSKVSIRVDDMNVASGAFNQNVRTYFFKANGAANPDTGETVVEMPSGAQYAKIWLDTNSANLAADYYCLAVGVYQGLVGIPNFNTPSVGWDPNYQNVSIQPGGIVIKNGSLTVTSEQGRSVIADGVLNSPSGQNLIVNGSFEQWDSSIVAGSYKLIPTSGSASLVGILPGGWSSTASANTLSITKSASANAKTGDYILVMKTDGTLSNAEITQWIPVKARKTYKLSGWSWKAAGGGQAATLTLHSCDSAGAVVGYTQATAITNATATVTYGEAIWTCPDDGTVAYVRISCRASNTPGNTEVFAFEDLVFEEMLDDTKPGGNLLANPSFEQRPPRGFDIWTPGMIPGWIYRAGSNAGVAAITGGDGNNMVGANTSGYARTGTHALQIRGDGATSWPSIAQDVAIRPGMTYRLSGYLAVGAGTSVARVRADSHDKAGTLVSTGVLSIQHNTSTMTFKEDATFTASETGTESWLRVYVYMDEVTPPATDTCVFDDISVEELAPGLENSPGEVLIDSAGVTITNGALTVTNSSATVIIDGTSNMFKISATGTQNRSVTQGTIGTTTVTTMTSLGTMSTTPGSIAYVSTSSANTGNKHPGRIEWASVGPTLKYASSTSGGTTNQAVLDLQGMGTVYTYINGSSYCVVELWAAQTNNGMGTITYYDRWYLLVEAAL